MSNTFSVSLPKNTNVQAAADMCRQRITGAGGKYEFDGVTGSFAVRGVDGTFIANGLLFTITVNNKPWYVTHAYVEQAIKGFFLQV
jgi:hypothetical protein